ncbi:ArnT family glycosyltransferase [Mycolicibacterium arseniciresistens]|uniref:Glycosyltransferase family 39 protein n=1 Tax=Mycolicibacterium arseniciresistens TaxID=3062257 RepID=A0ABT8U901_9MYCO|nr:glycosyltransferase family 39 protein [Mycolicibacterium arseniciresistens]MDO3634263.1 glycosyltransferase family 39 protein [Mycolicibacterium arseniciresistens]
MTAFARREVGIVVVIQAIVLTALSGRYGFHRDELYFRAAGQRLDWGYVDQPPLTPLLTRLFTFGDSPVGMRIAATLLGAAIVVVAALIAWEVGAGTGGQTVAAAATASSLFVLAVTHMLSTATADLLLWLVTVFFVLRLLRTGDPRWWPAVGVAVGVALTNKWLILLLPAALGLSLLAVGPRSLIRTWWLPAGVVVTAVVAAPVLVWQASHGFPLLTVAGGISASDGVENRLMFVPVQLVYLSPVLVPVAVVGFIALWRDRRFRSVALAYPVLCGLTLVAGGKPYYAIPLLVVLVAAGAEPAWQWARRHRAWAATGAVAGAALSVVLALPVLPVQALGPVLAVNAEQGEQVGWRDFTASVAAAHAQAGPSATIVTRNYGQAGAIERYGPEFGLPAPYSGHMSYWDWGPPPDSALGRVVVVGNRSPVFTGCNVVVTHRAALGNEENGTEIAVCDPVRWSAAWPQLRRFYN